MSCYVLGQGAWMPGYCGVEALVSQPGAAPDPDAQQPDIRGYPSRLMRGTSTLTQMCAAVARQALQQSAEDSASIPAVFASAFGEINIAIEQMQMMVTGDGKISPARFKNSVHNTSAGVFSIAHANHVTSTSVAAGELSVPYALLEGQMALDDGAPAVLVVVGDERLPEPLSELARWESFAAAWVLGRQAPADGRPVVHLSELRAVDGPMDATIASLQRHPDRGAFGLLSAIERQRTGRIGLGREDGEAWSIAVRIGAEAPR